MTWSIGSAAAARQRIVRTLFAALFTFALSCAAPQARADPAAPGPPPTSWTSTTLVFPALPVAAP